MADGKQNRAHERGVAECECEKKRYARSFVPPIPLPLENSYVVLERPPDYVPGRSCSV